MARKKSAAGTTTVTSENFADILIEGLREAVEVHEGRRQPAAVHSYPVPESGGAGMSEP